MISRWVHIGAVSLAVSLAGASVAGAQNVSKQQISKAFGYSDAAQFKPAVIEVARNLGRFNCGAAMTPAACKAVNKHFNQIVPKSLGPIRRGTLTHIENAYAGRGGLRAAMAEFNALPQAERDKKLCTGAINMRCKLLFDSMFRNLAPLVQKARNRAAREVKPFYKDGRPFTG
ncbi:hypothetical protein [Sulfitobacter donghicola]|uniref:Uncharacterized protein n=1 Tax=Sulfitobacter donghicola DSW-25 = KCTC 12864 = JCM 14565 TaxID=1300350 RepID=A0A073IGI4_9RHOB|nr:hypothetical protein [Sulfitobacter donghicola]KEJ88586.1 hypothetical protein DSW25_15445 [Sulfitobacter donghicola DSW-25 = KCTC 12864 = JCM 14565]KIN69642.1 hypothetical protein Z948_3390 [Sulfitobacter donghicola DSW-25 = KCTC 12864 = JCM 14565]